MLSLLRRCVRSVLWLTVCLALSGQAACVSTRTGQTGDDAPGQQPGFRAPYGLSQAQSLPEDWRLLGLRLEADALYGPDIDAILRTLEPPSAEPMGRKIHELYRIKFPPPPPPGALKQPPPKKPPPEKSPEKKPPVRVYPNVVTPANADACRAFITAHEAAFARAEKRYQVPRSIAASLLFVETRLGGTLGKHKVLYTLASMAASQNPGRLGGWLDTLDHAPEHMDWIGETMRKRSDWAYKELVAFLTYARSNKIDPLAVPGSMYGAMGICQFMPSSIPLFAADGNDDGIVDLFLVDDAVASLSNYLVLNGWKAGADRKAQFAALRRYNRQNIYANTILCLADLVRGEPVGQPVLTGGRKAPAKKSGIRNAPARKTLQAPARKSLSKKAPTPKKRRPK